MLVFCNRVFSFLKFLMPFLWINMRGCLHKAFTHQSACTGIDTMTKKQQPKIWRRRQDTERFVTEQIFIPNLLSSHVARLHNKGENKTPIKVLKLRKPAKQGAGRELWCLCVCLSLNLCMQRILNYFVQGVFKGWADEVGHCLCSLGPCIPQGPSQRVCRLWSTPGCSEYAGF